MLESNFVTVTGFGKVDITKPKENQNLGVQIYDSYMLWKG